MYPLEATTETIKIAETETDHAVLAGIRKATQSIRAMLLFFTILTIGGLIGTLLWAVEMLTR
jgi:hypothetical protein